MSQNSERETVAIFIEAAKAGDISVVKRLWTDPKVLPLQHEILNASQTEDWNALQWACNEGYKIIAEFLLDEGFDANRRSLDGTTPLILAAGHGHVEVAQLLLSRGADPHAASMTGDTALISAARKGHLGIAKLLLEAGVSPDYEGTCGNFSALALASRFGHTSIVEYLIESHATVDLPSFTAMTPLMFASQYRHTDCVRKLIDANAEVSYKEMGGRTALMLAAENGYEAIVALLLQAGAIVDVPASDVQGSTALSQAACRGYDRVVALLLKGGTKKAAKAFELAKKHGQESVLAEFLLAGHDIVDPDETEVKSEDKVDQDDLKVECSPESGNEAFETLQAAAGRGDSASVQRFLDEGPVSVALGSESPLLDAIRSGDLRTVEILTAAMVDGAAPNIQHPQALLDFGNKWGLTPLILAARVGRLDMIKVLLDAGASTDQLDIMTRRTALIEAVRKRSYDIVQTLIERGCNLNAGGKSKNALGHACSKNDLRMVEMLINAGAGLSNLDPKKAQPLIIAVQSSHTDLVQLLLNAGVDVHAKDLRIDKTALIVAAMKDDACTVKLLIDAGADMSTTVTAGWTALHFAARDGCEAAAKVLVKEGAEVDLAVSQGYTPLHLASRHGHTNIVRLLLRSGADVHCQTSHGEGSLSLAELGGFAEIFKLLLQHGATPASGDTKTSQVDSSDADESKDFALDKQEASLHSPTATEIPTEIDFGTSTSHILLGTVNHGFSSPNHSRNSKQTQIQANTSHTVRNGESLPFEAQSIRDACAPSLSPKLCNLCLTMIPPISELSKAVQIKEAAVGEQQLYYKDLVSSADQGCPGCRMALSFLARHWSRTDLTQAPISRHIEVNEKGFKGFQKLLTLNEGGSKDSKHVQNNARNVQFSQNGIGIGQDSPEEVQNKLLQYGKGTWDFQTLMVAYRVGKSSGPLCRFIVYTDADDPASIYTSSRLWQRDFKTQQAYDTALSWLQDCEKTHEGCGSSLKKALPTRLIDVGAQGEPPKLCDTRDEVGHYFALSYCWGGSQHYCTTTENIHSLLVEIENYRLPQTIKDAMDVTRHLGFRFLWVDAFCIIQDSDPDKAIELSRMSDVFKNAHLTISAAQAAQSEEGFLHPPKDLTVSPRFCVVPVRCEGGEVGTFTLEGPVWDWSFLHNNPDPILERAWTMQEHWLSSRLLSYGSKGMSWVCYDAQHRYGGATVDPFKDDLPRLDKEWYALNGKYAGDASRGEISNAEERTRSVRLWESLVGDYTRRKMSKDGDKLPALAGLAQEFGRVTKDRYLAGLWQKSLLDNLLWYSRQPAPKVGGYRAPSFSWATIDGPVGFVPRRLAFMLGQTFDCNYHRPWIYENHDHYRPYFKQRLRRKNHFRETKIISCDIEVKNDTLPHGEVVGGTLSLSCRIRPVMISKTGNRGTMKDLFTEEDFLAKVLLDTTEFAKGFPSSVQVWALPLRGGSGPLPLDGLLIIRVSSDKWRRIGIFAIPRIEKPERYRYIWIGIPQTVAII